MWPPFSGIPFVLTKWLFERWIFQEAQLKYLSALHYQVILLKCKIQHSNTVQLLPLSVRVAKQQVHIIQSKCICEWRKRWGVVIRKHFHFPLQRMRQCKQSTTADRHSLVNLHAVCLNSVFFMSVETWESGKISEDRNKKAKEAKKS